MKILVTGASGQLGAYVLQDLTHRPLLSVIAWSGRDAATRSGVPLQPVDLADLDALDRALNASGADAVIHLAAVASAEAARLDPDHAERINVHATRRIAEWAVSGRRRFVLASTDMVFAGDRTWNREDDPTEPATRYGQTKRRAEVAALAHPGTTVARLPLLFGPSLCGRASFFDGAVAALRRGESRSFFDDEFRTPLDYASAARGLVQLVLSDVAGPIHLAGPARLSRFELMTRAAQALRIDPGLVRANRRSDAPPGAEPRPADVSLATDRWQDLFPGDPWPDPGVAIRRLEERTSGG